MRIVRCDHCGAPLSLPESTSQIICEYCQHTTVSTSVPTSVEHLAKSGRESYVVGEAVLVAWNGRYWPARVLSVVAVDAFRIHYDGYSNNWDEIVGPDRIEPRGANVPLARVASPRLALALVLGSLLVVGAIAVLLRAPTASSAPVGGQPSFTAGAGAGAVSTSGPGRSRALGMGEALSVGQPILVSWNDRWWTAEVLAVSSDGTVRVHYTGWASSWDENVGPDRIRLP